MYKEIKNITQIFMKFFDFYTLKHLFYLYLIVIYENGII